MKPKTKVEDHNKNRIYIIEYRLKEIIFWKSNKRLVDGSIEHRNTYFKYTNVYLQYSHAWHIYKSNLAIHEIKTKCQLPDIRDIKLIKKTFLKEI